MVEPEKHVQKTWRCWPQIGPDGLRGYEGQPNHVREEVGDKSSPDL